MRHGADVVIARLFVRATAELGDVSILVNDAGNSTLDTIDNLPEADWDSVIDTHLKGTFLYAKAAINHMKARGVNGVIVNTSSVEAVASTRGNAHYSAAKAGIDKFTEVAALEAGRHGIRANGVAPGIIDTPMTNGAATPNSGRRGGGPSASTVSASPPTSPRRWSPLASDYASWITGVTLPVDGGTRLRGLPDYAGQLLSGTPS